MTRTGTAIPDPARKTSRGSTGATIGQKGQPEAGLSAADSDPEDQAASRSFCASFSDWSFFSD